MKFKLTATIPVVQYGNIMPEIEVEAEDLKTAQKLAFKQLQKIWDSYGERPLVKKGKKPKATKGEWRIVETFTGEKVKYNDSLHEYTDLEGNHLVSGSEYKKSFDKPFDTALLSGKVGQKYGVSPEVVAAMWKANSKISTTFGHALHLALEQWFKYKGEACGEKEYNLAKHPFLRTAVSTFPLKDEQVIPEIFLSWVASKMVGQADGLHVLGEKRGRIIDYKSDADISKNIQGHFKQLSWYSKILQNAGWSIEGIDVWNYTDKWEKYESEVLTVSENSSI